MRSHKLTALAILLASLTACRAPAPQPEIDLNLARQIAAIPAIDNHAHPMLSPPAMATDRSFDALPVDAMEPQTDPQALQPGNPSLQQAWKALFNFEGVPPLTPEIQKQLDAVRESVRQQYSENYSTYILNKANIGTMLANRVSMGTGVQPPRFRWVPYADALLFPLDNSGLAAATPDRKQFFPLEDKLRALYLQQANLKSVPTTLDAYLKQLVTPILEQQKANGAIAEKFEIAYLRSFGFEDVSQPEAAAIYAKLLHVSNPDPAQYKKLQDFLFRYIAAECGRLSLAVHIHTMAGAGSYFSLAGANALLLEPLFNDPRLRKTNFVMLHGGWPFVREAGSLLQKPNVYLDLSQLSYIISPRTMSVWLREWLELYPGKVLYATDAYPYSPAMGWEEVAYITNQNIRQSLSLALTDMIRDNQITPAHAQELARMVLRGNAEALYHLPTSEGRQ